MESLCGGQNIERHFVVLHHSCGLHFSQTRSSLYRPRCQWQRQRQTERFHRLLCRAGGKLYIEPVLQESTAFAPATIANLGPGFDWMGCAVEVQNNTFVLIVLNISERDA
jgi:hypothetical protein